MPLVIHTDSPSWEWGVALLTRLLAGKRLRLTDWRPTKECLHLISLALALIKSQIPQHCSLLSCPVDWCNSFCTVTSPPGCGFTALALPTVYVDRSWLKRGLNILVPQHDYSHIQGRWWKINEVILLFNMFKSCLLLLFSFSEFDWELSANPPLLCIFTEKTTTIIIR